MFKTAPNIIADKLFPPELWALQMYIPWTIAFKVNLTENYKVEIANKHAHKKKTNRII